jgi:oligopeptide transport system ATP-binding protein
MTEPLIEVRDLCKYFPVGKKQLLKAVDHVSFAIARGETLGLVGESGCGKTTCGRTALRLYSKTAGEIYFKGEEISRFGEKKLLAFKKSAQMIFQDPYSSLDPRMTIGEIVAEGMNVHCHYGKKEKSALVRDLLAKVSLTDDYVNRFAHELSGGQRQRVGIARALAVAPEFIVCDEPISALDVSIQAQIVNLLIRLQRENGLTYLFITHDLSMVRHISDRVGIMYLGSLVELGPSVKIFENPLHPYTKSLIAAIPEANPHAKQRRTRLRGEVPSPIHSPSGCKFRTRCANAENRCAEEAPEPREAEPGHFAACHLLF